MYIEICQGGAGGLYLLSPPPPAPWALNFSFLTPIVPPIYAVLLHMLCCFIMPTGLVRRDVYS